MPSLPKTKKKALTGRHYTFYFQNISFHSGDLKRQVQQVPLWNIGYKERARLPEEIKSRAHKGPDDKYRHNLEILIILRQSGLLGFLYVLLDLLLPLEEKRD